MNEYMLEKLANEISDEVLASNETRYFSFDPGIGDYDFDIEVNADVVCRHGIFTPEIQYIKVITERRSFYVGDGLYPFFEAEIELMAKDQDWSF